MAFVLYLTCLGSRARISLLQSKPTVSVGSTLLSSVMVLNKIWRFCPLTGSSVTSLRYVSGCTIAAFGGPSMVPVRSRNESGIFGAELGYGKKRRTWNNGTHETNHAITKHETNNIWEHRFRYSCFLSKFGFVQKIKILYNYWSIVLCRNYQKKNPQILDMFIQRYCCIFSMPIISYIHIYCFRYMYSFVLFFLWLYLYLLGPDVVVHTYRT